MKFVKSRRCAEEKIVSKIRFFCPSLIIERTCFVTPRYKLVEKQGWRKKDIHHGTLWGEFGHFEVFTKVGLDLAKTVMPEIEKILGKEITVILFPPLCEEVVVREELRNV